MPRRSALLSSSPAQQRASPLARAMLAAYVVLVVYSGLSPWSGWRDLGVSPWAFLDAPAPRHLTRFDLIVNVLGYLPLGALGVLALHPRLRGLAAVLAATAGGVLLAGAIEALQTYLPTRVSSNIDLATNSAGALLGALLAAPLAAGLIDRGRLMQLRTRWFRRDASFLLVVLALWPAAQMAALPMLFGNGALLDGAAVLDWLGWVSAQQRDAIFGPAEFVLAEAVVVVAGLLAAGLAAAAVMQPGAPRIRLLLALVAAALALRSLAYAISFGPDQAFVWLTRGAIGGLTLGLLTLLVMAHGRPLAVHAAALAATAIWIGVVNLVPGNPYHLDWLAGFRPGRLAHFQAVAHWLSLAWPLVLAAALLALSAVRGARR
jgi:VanZ family protein